MPRPSKTSPRTAVTTDRRLQAMQLRKQGLNLQEIGDELGISKPAAWALVSKALRDYADAHREETSQYVQEQLLRYEAIIKTNWDDATNPSSRDRHFAAKTIKECQVEMAKLLGLYAPVKQEVTGKDGGPLTATTTTVAVNADYSKLSTDELTQLIELLKKTQPPAGDGENN